MKRRLYLSLAVLSALICPNTYSSAQEPYTHIQLEKVSLCTDRSLYISGETIHFSAWVNEIPSVPQPPPSQVLYCELVSPDGTKQLSGKYPVIGHAADGCLNIPSDLLTGNYYLRSYTRSMRNGSPGNYAIVPVKIIHPDNPELAATTNGGEVETFIATDSVNAGIDMKIIPGDGKYYPGDTLRISIKGFDYSGKLCLSVIPSATQLQYIWEMPKESIPATGITYPKETRGLSLSGTVKRKDNGESVPEIPVYLSILGDKDIMITRSDTSGRFFFALPSYYGRRDIFLSTREIPEIPMEVFIDNDFCTEPISLPSPEFNLDENEKAAALKLAINQKITRAFYPSDSLSSVPEGLAQKSFYGEPSEILSMERYIDLLQLEDYFREIPVMVKVKKNQDRKSFTFFSEMSEMSIYEPLVMIDYVAVEDIEKVLAIPPREIDRVELIPSPYIKGDFIFGGLINIISKNNDFGGVNLPESGTFISYRFLEACRSISIPVQETKNLPDSRNTVVWIPDLGSFAGSSKETTFIAPATPGKYSIVIQEISDQGNTVLGLLPIEVSLSPGKNLH